VILANLAGFLIFVIVLGILGGVAQIYDRGGIAPGIFFVPLSF
jgi:hypothetical protein